MEQVREIIKELVRSYREKTDQSKDGKKKSFLEKALDLADREESNLTEEQMVRNLLQLILAGTDTSSNTAAFCLWELANDKSGLQNELHKELLEENKDFEALTMEDIKSGFPRLWSFIWEILRLKGPAASLYLEPSEDLENFCGQQTTISPGTIVCALIRRRTFQG